MYTLITFLFGLVSLLMGWFGGRKYGVNEVMSSFCDVSLSLIDSLDKLPEGEYSTGATAYIAKMHVALHDKYSTPIDISYTRQVANDNP